MEAGKHNFPARSSLDLKSPLIDPAPPARERLANVYTPIHIRVVHTYMYTHSHTHTRIRLYRNIRPIPVDRPKVCTKRPQCHRDGLV